LRNKWEFQLHNRENAMIELGTVPMQTGIEDHGPTGSTAACAALLSGRQSTTESSADPPLFCGIPGPVLVLLPTLLFSCFSPVINPQDFEDKHLFSHMNSGRTGASAWCNDSLLP
jgi:hypothetical protein